MAIEDFLSGRGWDIDLVSSGNELQIGDRLYIATFGNNNVFLMFERQGNVFRKGRALYKPNAMGGAITGTIDDLFVRLQFAGNALDVYYSTSAPAPSPNGGGTSSGPGGN
ncbi:MAG: hypothetical protein BGP24_01525 [Lysobacterales bacterium 69-70]|nr:hypothetical protein [Xanthomonadaceae bacterium]ODU36030.1 MAG: hypothetical protein ABS97_01445 [Xanthomonadaceae bacterium SCN 69-320]ODV18226.1 MAG: hypothetical protein ABT27_14995 [Xanthomonadaceae bacterium SCN 69-25]OJY99509.1 MAG: hypothetical protein BGP24_01525 [Xanthomonadales bacterium 69-70]